MENRGNGCQSKRFDEEYLAGKYEGKKPAKIVCDWNLEFGDYIKELGGQIAVFGIGPGRNLPSYAETGYAQIIGIDFNSVAIERCQKKVEENAWPNVELIHGDWKKSGLKTKSCVAIFAINTLQFVNGPEEAQTVWQEVGRILVPGGLFLARVNSDRFSEHTNHHNVSEDGKTYQIAEGSRKGIIKHCYSEDELKNLAKKTGFEIVEISHRTHLRTENKLSPEYMEKYGDLINKRVGTKSGKWRVVFKKI